MVATQTSRSRTARWPRSRYKGRKEKPFIVRQEIPSASANRMTLPKTSSLLCQRAAILAARCATSSAVSVSIGRSSGVAGRTARFNVAPAIEMTLLRYSNSAATSGPAAPAAATISGSVAIGYNRPRDKILSPISGLTFAADMAGTSFDHVKPGSWPSLLNQRLRWRQYLVDRMVKESGREVNLPVLGMFEVPATVLSEKVSRRRNPASQLADDVGGRDTGIK